MIIFECVKDCLHRALRL